MAAEIQDYEPEKLTAGVTWKCDHRTGQSRAGVGAAFLSVAEGIREAKAKARYEAKLDHIDAALRLHGLPDSSGVQQHQASDSAPRVPESGVQRAELHEGRIKDNRRA